jgi:hypothetical protein
MKRLLIAITLVLALAVPGLSFSEGLAPWKFGMSKSEVTACKKFGPYQSFSNGDLETNNGIYDGKKENVQFFFDSKGLQRIGVYLYEGKDIQAAKSAWGRAYDSLAKRYGKVATPDIKVKETSDPATSETLSIAAAVNVEVTGKTQMAPVHQPKNMSVFSSFQRQEVQEGRYYYVVIYLDSRP